MTELRGSEHKGPYFCRGESDPLSYPVADAIILSKDDPAPTADFS